MAVPSPVGDVKIVSPISTFHAKYLDTQIKGMIIICRGSFGGDIASGSKCLKSFYFVLSFNLASHSASDFFANSRFLYFPFV